MYNITTWDKCYYSTCTTSDIRYMYNCLYYMVHKTILINWYLYYWYMWHTCTMLLFELHVRVFNTTCVCNTCNIQHFRFLFLVMWHTFLLAIQVFLLHVIYILQILIHMHTLLLFYYMYLHYTWNVHIICTTGTCDIQCYYKIIDSAVPLDPSFVL